jgi:Tfp pilus assembly protein PilF
VIGGKISRAAALAVMLVLTGCQSKAIQEFPLAKLKAEHMLDTGIRQYDNSDYRIAARTIQAALDEGLTTRSQARAHKYLAFIDCVSGQQGQCRDQFRKALQIDPGMQLRAEESGHPIWGPVFKSVKASMPKQ